MSEEQVKNPLDQIENDNSQEETQQEGNVGEKTDGNVADATDGSEKSTNVEPSTLQPTTQETAPEEQITAPEAPTAPPVIPTPVHTAPVTPPASVKAELSEPDFRMVANKRYQATIDRLKAQTKVWFHIPVVPGEAQGLAYESVTIDGYRMEVKKGAMVELPRQVAEILAEKYQVELNAGRESRIDGNQDRANALS